MREWLVGGAVIEGPEGVLLVRNRRRNGSHDWSTPGGVIDPGETLLEGLTREVAEETGLVVTGWEGPIYAISAEAPDLGWRLRVEVHRATGYEGYLVVDDPDGIVVEARFVSPDACVTHLDACQQWVREPLSEWIADRFTERRDYGYRVLGADVATLAVHRT
ncbi:hypothetical protein BH24ACT3_BH24ACT3_13700 [soil metagenome]